MVGSAFGGVDFLEAQQVRMKKRHDLSVSPFLVPGLLINQAAGQISQHMRLYGPSAAPTNACAIRRIPAIPSPQAAIGAKRTRMMIPL